jgi:hypothetical protein
MTPKLFQRRSLELTAAEWEVIESLAAETESIAPSGPNAGKPSWRTLIKRIADKEITLQPRQ